MKHNEEELISENGIELLVSYEYEISESQKESGHGDHEVGLTVETDLKTVEIVIAKKGIDILPQLNKRQINAILDKLTYK